MHTAHQPRSTEGLMQQGERFEPPSIISNIKISPPSFAVPRCLGAFAMAFDGGLPIQVMAGDWIKVEHALPDKPEVIRIADILGIDPDAVVGKLVRFWTWCDIQSVDGNALTVTKAFLDRHTFQPGFADALIQVDWLRVRSGSLEVPHFDRHNGQTSKSRAMTNRRVAKSRESNADSVADETPAPLQIPLPEKRREEVDTTPTKGPSGPPVSLEDARRIADKAGWGISAAEAEMWWVLRSTNNWQKLRPNGPPLPITAENWQTDLRSCKGWLNEQTQKSKINAQRTRNNHGGGNAGRNANTSASAEGIDALLASTSRDQP